MDLKTLALPTAKVTQLNQKGIFTIEDLIRYIPRKYYDYRESKTIATSIDDEQCAITGTIKSINKNSVKNYTKAEVADTDGVIFDIYWFGSPFMVQKLKIGDTMVFCGKPTKAWNNRRVMSNPMIFYSMKQIKGMYPVYKKVRGMSDEYLKNAIDKAIKAASQDEYLERSVVRKFNLISSQAMIQNFHKPEGPEEIKAAQDRMVFDQLFELALTLERDYSIKDKTSNVNIPNLTAVKPFLDTLPFKLTDGRESQLETVRAITRKMRKGVLTSSLVQGDVGCGKTMVALLLMLIMAENGYQSTLMAPTTILATQHYNDIQKYFGFLSFVKPVLLTSNMKVKEKREVLKAIEDGTANMIIGTHSVVSDSVMFNNLGLSIVDEEHRFGVAQRDKINSKTPQGVHRVTMSATPIPRTLGMSMYGEGVDIYTITQKPAGRKPAKTILTADDKNVFYDSIQNEINKGHQAYIVCPLIDESDSERMLGVMSVEEEFKEATKYLPTAKIGLINGKMKPEQIDEELKKFSNKDYDIIISTTIIEVGVNVPNATVIAIKNAERFGLAQLHQLRGRVVRSNDQGYCILSSLKEDADRLKAMVNTSDGFKISEEDLKLRGIGELIGTKQSGKANNVQLMLLNPQLYTNIRKEVKAIVADPARKQRYSALIDWEIFEKEH